MKGYAHFDLEMMEAAPNYNSWIYSLVRPFLSGKVLEIGPGIGNITGHVAAECKSGLSLTCIEPNIECAKKLESNLGKLNRRIPFEIHIADFMQFDVKGSHDTVLLINVLEHIEDDAAALKKIHLSLKEGGRLLLFIPAFQYLYSDIDKKLKHRRRYGKREIRSKLKRAGFSIDCIRYYNTAGFIGWWLNKVLKKKTQSVVQINVFDKIVLPLQSKIESFLKLPFGQSIFCVAVKTDIQDRS